MPLSVADLDDIRISPADTGLPARAAGLTVGEFLDTEPTLDEFWTPLLVLDDAALRANARAIQSWCDERGLELMPHGKTTMAPALWRLQLDAGATGLTLATPGQVRTARAFGVASVMLANALVAPAALAWAAAELADPGFELRVWADSIDTVDAMETGLGGLGDLPRPIDVLVELGAPGGRTGARTLDEARRLAERIAASPVLRLAGTAGYEGALGHDRSTGAVAAVRGYLADLVRLHETIAGLADGDLLLTAGGSAYLDFVAEAFAAPAAQTPGTRRVLRSGASLVHDEGFYRGISPIDDRLTPAMRGLARVVSHPEPGLALLDGGKRDFPYDEGLPVPLTLAGASATALNDQHTFLRAASGARDATGALDVAVGDVVELGLSHPCTAFDKRRLIPVVERFGSDRVVALVRTFF